MAFADVLCEVCSTRSVKFKPHPAVFIGNSPARLHENTHNAGQVSGVRSVEISRYGHFQDAVRIGPRAEIMEFSSKLLGPPVGGVRKQRESGIWLGGFA